MPRKNEQFTLRLKPLEYRLITRAVAVLRQKGVRTAPGTFLRDAGLSEARRILRVPDPLEDLRKGRRR